MLGDQCIHVLPGDRLGLFFNTTVAPVSYGSDIFHYQSTATEFPSVNVTLQFKNDMTVLFVATGFVHVSKYLDCNKYRLTMCFGDRDIKH